MTQATNPQLELAFDYVRYTSRHIFLTGKAGTGKTTFLHRIKAEGFKRMVVTAPTGVAAINAGGMTLHSFFQLPFGLHIPGATRAEEGRRRFSSDKINLIRSLELLVIDEISMVRADLLDAIDDVLRRYADRSRPFGGVQLLMIGDLHQLPPVVKPDDWKLLKPHYDSPYFFSSLALKRTEMISIELKHIYRQSDGAFIDLLNKVRNKQIDTQVLATLNQRYRPESTLPSDGGYITLTSHNAAAAAINSRRLESVEQPLRRFQATVEGDFPEIAYPTDGTLQFKKGAQVMFVKNDASPQRRYFNGKIGTIQKFGDGEIIVRGKGEASDIAVEPAEWQNIRYSINPQSKEIQEELLGTFKQYPLKLAWAITIHKSQGLTFDHVVIDAGAAFAHGQVYVALSRCRSLEGIILSSRIQPVSVKTDQRVSEYTTESSRVVPDEQHLRESKRLYQAELVSELFNFGSLERRFQQLSRTFRQHGNALSPEGRTHFDTVASAFHADVVCITNKFLPQLKSYLGEAELPEENANLRPRIQKAADYFSRKLHDEILPEIRKIHLITDDKAVIKTAQEQLHELQREVFAKHACFAASHERFSTAAYLRAKTNVELQFVIERRVAATTIDQVPADVPHPLLYGQLLRWRSETSSNLGIAPRQVLSTRSLRELVRFMPTQKASLKRMRGIGALKVQEFGDAIIGIIRTYCEQNKVEPDLAKLPQSKTPHSRRMTLDLLKAGKTIEQIAAERDLAIGTIEAHLAQAVAGKELNIFDVVPKQAVDQINDYFLNASSLSLVEAKSRFEDQYSYGQLRMVLEHFRLVQASGSLSVLQSTGSRSFRVSLSR
jgi:hypothetical protein